MRNNNVIITGGKTGGHIYPALAIGKIIKEEQSSGVIYVGAKDGLEEKVVKGEDVIFLPLKLGPMVGVKLIVKIKSFFKLIFGVFKAMRIISKYKPKLIVGTGGFVSGAVLIAAVIMRYPFVIHEQNVSPGLTNKKLSRFAKEVWMTFSESSIYFSKKTKKVLVGMPLRKEFSLTNKEKYISASKMLPNRKTVLITGGSQGSLLLNDVIVKIYEQVCDDLGMNIVHITGMNHYEKIIAGLSQREKELLNEKKLDILPYDKDMLSQIYNSNIVISRSGASIICELLALSKYSILIPITNSAANHQIKNATTVEKTGLGSIIYEKDFSDNSLYERLKEVDQIDLDSLEVKETTLLLGNNTDTIIRKEIKKYFE